MQLGILFSLKVNRQRKCLNVMSTKIMADRSRQLFSGAEQVEHREFLELSSFVKHSFNLWFTLVLCWVCPGFSEVAAQAVKMTSLFFFFGST